MKAALIALALLAATAANTQTPALPLDCHTITDDEARLACYEIEKTVNARWAYAKQLEKWFLSNGISIDVLVRSPALNSKYPGPYLMFSGYLSKAMVFQLASKGALLKNAAALGFKGVDFYDKGGDEHYLFDVSNGLPRCDVFQGLCLD
jgi:hypothetical protein